MIPLANGVRGAAGRVRQLGADLVEAFQAVWRRSLQMRVVISTLALSTAVVVVLGLVLQTQIALRVLQGKEADTLVRADAGRVLLERDLSGVDPDRDGTQGELNNALDRLTTTSAADEASSPTAGEFRAVLTTGRRDGGADIAAGPVEDVPVDLRHAVAQGTLSRKYVTLTEGGLDVPTLLVGQPVRTAGRDLEFYLLFPLTAEQRTLGLVQSTLIVGGLILLLLLAGIASIVTRQVVRPVRQAAEIAERFADGHLDERMPVQGEDELARLGESYNEMAGSIQSQIRQLEEFGALQRRFTSDVSHELRTPLTTVRMAADVLYASREELLPALRRSSELLVAELDRFEALLGDLLEISRLDAGVAELGAERVDVRGVVLRAVESVRGIADETETPLRLDLPAGVYAEIDPRRVERIVRNLVANAVDHGAGRPVRVVLGWDERAVAVVVRDNGVGLRPGEAALVFNRFWRAEESRARRSGGSGLGLAISIEDARLHGGWLEAWGEPGRGAAFRLTLPRTVGEEVDSSPLPLGPEPAGQAPGQRGQATSHSQGQAHGPGQGHGPAHGLGQAPQQAGSVLTPPIGWPVIAAGSVGQLPSGPGAHTAPGSARQPAAASPGRAAAGSTAPPSGPGALSAGSSPPPSGPDVPPAGSSTARPAGWSIPAWLTAPSPAAGAPGAGAQAAGRQATGAAAAGLPGAARQDAFAGASAAPFAPGQTGAGQTGAGAPAPGQHGPGPFVAGQPAAGEAGGGHSSAGSRTPARPPADRPSPGRPGTGSRSAARHAAGQPAASVDGSAAGGPAGGPTVSQPDPR